MVKQKGKRQEKQKEKEIFVGALAIITDGHGKVLITKRHQPDIPWAHEKLQIPGGGVEFGEHPIEAVIRETQEEVGLDIEVLTKNPIIYSEVRKQMGKHLLFFCYPAKIASGEIDVSKDDETSDAFWLSPSEIDFENSLPGMKFIIEEAKEFIL